MTEEDREFVRETAKATAHEVAGEVIKRLPCNSHEKLIIKHEAQLNNGLTNAVKKLDKTMGSHIKAHEDDRKARDKGRRGAWRMFVIGTATPIISGLILFFLLRMFG